MTQAQPGRYPQLPWKFPILLLLMLVVGFVVLFIWQGKSFQALAGEEIHFNHQKHIASGIQCLFCHPGAINGPVAGVPSLQKCMGCHQAVTVTNEKGKEDVETLLRMWEEKRPLHWVKTFDQPDFVFFNHAPHATGGVSCETCHGNVSEMVVIQEPFSMNMGFCLDCHRRQDPEKQVRLMSCATCHQ